MDDSWHGEIFMIDEKPIQNVGCVGVLEMV